VPSISVLIPVLDGGAELVRCLTAIAAQRIEADVEIVVVDSGSRDGTPEAARSHGARVHEIPPSSFGHGRTRNLAASLSQGETLVFTTHDAVALDVHWLRSLVAPLDASEVAGVYGRQIPHVGARPPEQFFLDFLYGPAPRIQRLSPGAELDYEATLFSNVSSAMRRATWEAFPFRDDIIMSEDQEWSRRVLRAGHTIVYEPRAVVRHSHSYTVGEAMRRFYDSGVSADLSYVEGSGSRRTLRRAGLRYGRDELAWLWSTGRRRWIPYTVVYETAKFVGLQLGLRHERLPGPLRRRLGYYRRTDVTAG
jgi:rhamnosyltransferase